MLVFTLADDTAEQIAFERQCLAAVSASHPGNTLLRLTDGRRFRVRETFIDVLDRWAVDRRIC